MTKLTPAELTALLAPVREKLDELDRYGDAQRDGASAVFRAVGVGILHATGDIRAVLDRLDPPLSLAARNRLAKESQERDRLNPNTTDINREAFLRIDKVLADAGAYAAIPKGVSYPPEAPAQVVVGQRDAALGMLRELRERFEIEGEFDLESARDFGRRVDALLAAAYPKGG